MRQSHCDWCINMFVHCGEFFTKWTLSLTLCSCSNSACIVCAEAVFFGNSFASKAPPSHRSTHDQEWQTAKIALISTVLWVPVGIGMILVSLSAVRYSWHLLECACSSRSFETL